MGKNNEEKGFPILDKTLSFRESLSENQCYLPSSRHRLGAQIFVLWKRYADREAERRVEKKSGTQTKFETLLLDEFRHELARIRIGYLTRRKRGNSSV